MQPEEQNQPVSPQEPEQNADWQQPVASVAANAPVVESPAVAGWPVMQAESPVSDELAPEAQTPVSAPESMQNESDVSTESKEMMTPVAQEGDDGLVRWQATEHIHREKDAIWYGLFAIVVVALIGIAIFLIKSWTFAVLVPVMAAALVIYARRPPALLDYTLSRKGLHINDKLYGFDLFKEFGLVHDDDENVVYLVPRKRFQPSISVYFPDEVGEVVVDMLAGRLPMHEVRLDPIDRLIRRLHI